MSVYATQTQNVSIPRYFPVGGKATINKVLVTAFTEKLTDSDIVFDVHSMLNGYATIYINIQTKEELETLDTALAECKKSDEDCCMEYWDLGLSNFELWKGDSYCTHYLKEINPQELEDRPKDSEPIKPKLLVMGSDFPSVVLQKFYADYIMKDGPMETWGFGYKSHYFDHWYPASDKSAGAMTGLDTPSADIVCKNRTGVFEHCFDAVLLSLYSWNGSVHKYHALIEWADQKLKPGGLLILYGTPMQFQPPEVNDAPLWETRTSRPVLNIIVHRYENISVEWTNTRQIILAGTKKHERSRDDDMKEMLISALTLGEHSISGVTTRMANAVLLPREVTYKVAADPNLCPVVFSHDAKQDYLERFVPESPFSLIKKTFERNEESKVPTLAITPRLENLLKLNEYMKGVVKGPDGAWVITKGTAETSYTTFTDEDGNTVNRQRKRTRQVFAYLTDPEIITSDGPRKGDIGIVDAG